MKRIISILLVLCTLFALGACNSEGDTTDYTTIPNPDIEPISIDDVPLAKYLDNCAYFGRCNWNQFTTEEQKAISAKARDAQVTLNIDDNGVITLIDMSGIVIRYGGTWPSDYSFLTGFPVPENRVAYSGIQTGVMCYVGLYMTTAEAKEYKNNLAALGFDQNSMETENDKTYYYHAVNADGMMAIVVCEVGITLVSVMPTEHD